MRQKLLLILFIISLLVFTFLGLWLYYNKTSKVRNLEINFFDVGQGDAILIKTPAGQNILIDGGPGDIILKRLRENLPFWERKIDLMILTHPHADHVTGLIPVLKYYKVKKILYTGVYHSSPVYSEWLNLIQEKHISTLIIEKPQNIDLGAGCKIKILFPIYSFADQRVESLNNTSIALKLIYGQISFLLAGDLDKEAEQELLQTGVNLSSTVFKANHHGSREANSQEFLNKVKPEIIVISVGTNNDYGHPHKEVLKRFKQSNAQILRTDKNGTIKIVSDGKTANICH